MKLSRGGSLRRAGWLIGCGLVVQAISLQFVHPLAFMGFAFFGVLPVALGLLDYLLAVLRSQPSTDGCS